MKMLDRNIMSFCEVVKDCLYFVSVSCKLWNNVIYYYFSVDYDWFFDGCKFYDIFYFGLVNLVGVYWFCCFVNIKFYVILVLKKIVFYIIVNEGFFEVKKWICFVFLCGVFVMC